MKITHIVNNFGKTYDGIGAYAKVMYDNLPKGVEEVVYSAVCRESKNKFKYMFNFGMTKEIFRCVKNFFADKADVVLIEYPFMEWNPLILIPIYCLFMKCRRYKIPLIISLHEYGRTHCLRKLMSRQICKIADHVFVTTEEMKKDITEFSSRVSIRNPPSSIWNKEVMQQDITKDYNSFSYFGLITSAKAFSEMMDAWDEINRDGNRHIYILSATMLGNIEKQHKGVTYIYNADDEMILKTLRRCAYCFIPIKPEIDSKNTTFKTASVAGCISVGKFCTEMADLPFVIPMNGYQIKDFIEADGKMSGLTEEIIQKKTALSAEYGKQFCPPNTFGEMINTIEKIVCEKGGRNKNK